MRASSNTAWFIWWERRQLTHGEGVQPIKRSVMSISALALNYVSKGNKTIIKPLVRQNNPPEGIYMVNVDASLNPETHVAASDVVIRDCNGGFVASRYFKIEGAIDVLMAGAYAAWDGVQFAQQMGHFKVILQCDNDQVISTLSAGDFSATATSAFFS